MALRLRGLLARGSQCATLSTVAPTAGRGAGESAVCVLGAGSFGSAVAHVLSRGGGGGQGDGANTVKLWARRSSIADEINLHRTNTQYADGVVFSENVTSSASVEECLDGAGVVVIAVPGAYLHPLLDKIVASTGTFAPNPVIVSLVKSLHFDEKALRFSTMCEDIQQVVENSGADLPVVALSGPNLYAEMLRNEFAEATIGYANGDRAAALHVQRVFTTPSFCTSVIPDRLGVELCGGLKNVVSLAAGFCEGLGMGANTKAAVIRCGLLEMARLPGALGISFTQEDTILREACGVGDLILTCTVGRGRVLAAAFVDSVRKHGPAASAEESTRRWENLERNLMNGMKLPDWHNARVVQKALVARGCGADQFPLFHAVHDISYAGLDPSEILPAIVASSSAT